MFVLNWEIVGSECFDEVINEILLIYIHSNTYYTIQQIDKTQLKRMDHILQWYFKYYMITIKPNTI